jgi:undecaprenyl diphosphate synthase
MQSHGINHIAYILDGNRRWAKKNGLKSNDGHHEGVKNVFRILKETREKYKIKFATIYALSVENLKRNEEELSYIYKYLLKFMNHRIIANIKKEKIKLSFIGNISLLPEKVQILIDNILKIQVDEPSFYLQVAIGYGARQDILNACKKVANKVLHNELKVDDINEEEFVNNVSTKEIPYPDFLIRTGGEQRISNFLLWEMAYTEFYFCEKMWPEFDKNDLQNAIKDYITRDRRYGQ